MALVPARSESKGLKGKNIMNLCGHPLLAWPIRAAIKSKYVDTVIVSTENAAIASIAKEHGAEVPFMRPPEFATDTATSIEVIAHALGYLHTSDIYYYYLVLLEPTSPLTESEDVDLALELLDSKRNIADSIVGVSKVEATHPSFNVLIKDDGRITPYMNDNFVGTGRRQDLSDLYFLEGSLYISDVDILLKQKMFYHKRTLPYVVPRYKSFEIDDLLDFLCVETIMKNIDKIKRET